MCVFIQEQIKSFISLISSEETWSEIENGKWCRQCSWYNVHICRCHWCHQCKSAMLTWVMRCAVVAIDKIYGWKNFVALIYQCKTRINERNWEKATEHVCTDWITSPYESKHINNDVMNSISVRRCCCCYSCIDISTSQCDVSRCESKIKIDNWQRYTRHTLNDEPPPTIRDGTQNTRKALIRRT